MADAPDHLEENNPKPLDEDDIALLKTYVGSISHWYQLPKSLFILFYFFFFFNLSRVLVLILNPLKLLKQILKK